MDGLFNNPAMAWWAAAAGVPLLIHLLSKRRYRRVPWAAMTFLQRAFKKTSKRLRIENLLLLLVRMAVLMVLALALADPRISSSAIFGAAGGGSRDVVIVLDDSFSMDVRDAADVARFERAKRTARRLLADLDRDSDAAALVTSGRPARLVIPLTREIDRVAAALDAMNVSHAATDTIGALDRVRSLLADPEIARTFPGAKVIYWISDLQKTPLLSDAALEARDKSTGANDEIDPRLLELLEDLDDVGAKLVAVDVDGNGPDRLPNVAVVELRHVGRTLVQGIPTTFECRVRNFGGTSASGELQFFVDQEAAFEQREQVGGLEGAPSGPLSERSFTFDATFASPGWHWVTCKYVDDVLGVDNVRRLAVRVRDHIRVLAVDGVAARLPEDTATFYVARALDPFLGRGSETSGSFRVDEVSIVDYQAKKLEDYDLVVMADVAGLSTRQVDDLQNWVENGGALIWFAGRTVEGPGRIGRGGTANAVFHRNGAGLLAGRMVKSVGSDETTDSPYFLQIERFDHPALAYFADERRQPALTRWPVYKFVEVVPDDRPDVSTLAWFRKGNEDAQTARLHPAILEKRLGKGRTIMLTTSADRTWNLYGTTPAFVPLMRELAYYATRTVESDNLIVGSPLVISFDPTIRKVEVRHGNEPPIERSTSLTENNERAELTLNSLARVELISIRPLGASGTAQNGQRLIAVNADPAESDLESASREWLVERLGSDRIEVADQIEDLETAGASTESRGIWRALLYAVVALLVAETVLAQRFTRSDRMATGV